MSEAEFQGYLIVYGIAAVIMVFALWLGDYEDRKFRERQQKAQAKRQMDAIRQMVNEARSRQATRQ